MPQFYFDVIVYGKLVKDQKGMNLSDIVAAESEAAHSAMAIAYDEFPSRGGNGMVVIDVRNETGQRVASATAMMALQMARIRRAARNPE